jgi:predicted Zn-dependent peptidase
VREKRSLAYYAHAQLDRFKGLLLVQIGLDEAAAPEVEAQVMAQLEALAQGAFDDQELETARAGLLSALAAVDDSIAGRIEFTARQWFRGQARDPDAVAAEYARLGAGDVTAAVQDLWLDHAYLLAPLEGGKP